MIFSASGGVMGWQAMIKDIVVGLSVGGPRDVAADYALSLCPAFEAHVTGIAFAFEPVVPGTVFGGMPYELIEASRTEGRKAAETAVARFEHAARNAGQAFESRMLDTTVVAAAELFGCIARRHDVAVLKQAEPDRDGTEELLIEAALFRSGRPLIVVPYIQKTGFATDRVLIAWDGSQTAARAIGDALPFLVRAKAVELVIVATDKAERDQITGAAVARHLARHDLKVEIKRIVAADIDVANTILSHAADSSADFLVMGGYGHSRMREFILGGATHGILQSMTLPVLMSH